MSEHRLMGMTIEEWAVRAQMAEAERDEALEGRL